jgi:hypothetical protein
MQAIVLVERTGVEKACLDEWTRQRNPIVVPRRPWGGRGRPAEYDEANVIALRIALALRDMHVVVRHWAPAFQEITAWLRQTPEPEWSKHRVLIRVDNARFSRVEFPLQVVGGAFVYELARLVEARTDHGPAGRAAGAARAE